MKHSFAATNPCHVYDMALALWEMEGLETYYSGYPRWKLRPPPGFPITTCAFRTVVTYGMQRLPEWMRFRDDRMFRWQDEGFDKGVSHLLRGNGFIHGLPGQCRDIFREAVRRGLIPVLNHASGPIAQQRALIAPEYARHGIDLEAVAPMPATYTKRISEERQLAAFHCVASTIVRDQLMEEGISADEIWVVPYGADAALFPKRKVAGNGTFRVCFAGRQSLRKGIHYLLKALEKGDLKDCELHCFGMAFRETARDFEEYKGAPRIIQRGSLPQSEFARALHEMDVLVLPSAEEAFGLVVVQALECGVPCIVSDRVGAKDLIREGENGSIVPFGNTEALVHALHYWSKERRVVVDHYPWSKCAESLVSLSKAYKD